MRVIILVCMLGLLAGILTCIIRDAFENCAYAAERPVQPEVHEVLLSDGTRCALNPRGGITCNWRRK